MKALITLACSFACTSLFAGTITFDDAPSTFSFDNHGGQQDLGSFYTGVTFGPGAQIIHTSSEFPASSGTAELFQSQTLNDLLTITFATPQNSVSFDYTSRFGIAVTAFGAGGNPISLLQESENVNLTTGAGSNSIVSINQPGIKSINIVDNSQLGQFFTIDDLSSPGIGSQSVPDTTNTLALLAGSGVVLWGFRRKFAVG